MRTMEGLRIGTRFEREITLDEEEVRRGATAIGDFNPLHHDAAAAAASRFGGLIASGADTVGRLLGVMGSEVPRFGPSVGLDCAFRFRRPVRPGRRLLLQWEVVAIEPAPKLGGEIVRLEGRIADAETGEVALEGSASGLMLGDGGGGGA